VLGRPPSVTQPLCSNVAPLCSDARPWPLPQKTRKPPPYLHPAKTDPRCYPLPSPQASGKWLRLAPLWRIRGRGHRELNGEARAGEWRCGVESLAGRRERERERRPMARMSVVCPSFTFALVESHDEQRVSHMGLPLETSFAAIVLFRDPILGFEVSVGDSLTASYVYQYNTLFSIHFYFYLTVSFLCINFFHFSSID
jgi:hypothetical protein